MNDAQADAAQAENRHRGTRGHFRGVEYGTNSRRNTAAEEADLLQRRFLRDLRNGDLRQHGVFRERRGTHEVKDGLPAAGEPARTVGHHAPTLRHTNRLAKIGLARRAEGALATLRGIQRDHVVTHLHAGHAFSNLLHDGTALVTQNRRESPLWIVARQRIGICVTDSSRYESQEYFTVLGSLQIDLFDRKRFAGLPSHSGACLHAWIPLIGVVRGPSIVSYPHGNLSRTRIESGRSPLEPLTSADAARDEGAQGDAHLTRNRVRRAATGEFSGRLGSTVPEPGGGMRDGSLSGDRAELDRRNRTGPGPRRRSTLVAPSGRYRYLALG